MKIISITILILLFPLFVFAQEDKPQPDRWRELVIDESTPEDALTKLGKPSKDKPADSFRVYQIEGLLSKEIRQKKYRRLEYKNIADFDKVILAFDQNKLVFIELNPKKLDPNVLSKAYGIDFSPVFNKLNLAFNPRDFERDAGRLEARKYPVWYHLLARSDKTFLVAGVDNSSIGSILGGGSYNNNLTYPGKVVQFQIVSRKLENNAGMDSLK